MDLDSGDVGIEDTLYQNFSEEYEYIKQLGKYLKNWVRTICIRDLERKTSIINESNDVLYVNLNDTAVLETVYKITEDQIIHIHGSLRNEVANQFLDMEI